MRMSLTAVTLVLLGSVCHAEEPKLLATILAHKGAVRAVAVSPSGDLLASAGDDGSIRLWEILSHKNLTTLTHGSPVLSIAFSNNGRLLALGGKDGTIKVWDGKIVTTFRGRFAVRNIAFTNGDLWLRATYPVASCPNDGVDSWNLATGKPPQPTQYDINCITPSLEVVCADGQIARVDERDFRYDPPVCVLEKDIEILGPSYCPLRRLFGHGGRINCLAANDNGAKPLASGSDDGTVKLWDVTRGTCTATLTPNQGAVYGVAFSPDGRVLVSGGADGTIAFWRMPGEVGGRP
jgi:WD40 repeat protein